MAWTHGILQLFSVVWQTNTNFTRLFNHIFSNAPNNISSISVPQYSISDHLPVCQNLSDKGSAHKYIRYRKTEQFDEFFFLSDLAQQSWSNINSYEDPSAAVQSFNDIFLSLLDKHAPLKKKRVKKCQQPGWMNQVILIPSTLETNFTMKRIWITIKFGEIKWNPWFSSRNRNFSMMP